jgi:hypothetical protein
VKFFFYYMNIFFIYQIQRGRTNSTRITLVFNIFHWFYRTTNTYQYLFMNEKTTTNNNNEYDFKVLISKGLEAT